MLTGMLEKSKCGMNYALTMKRQTIIFGADTFEEFFNFRLEDGEKEEVAISISQIQEVSSE